MRTTVWTLVVDHPDAGISTTVHSNEDEAVDAAFEMTAGWDDRPKREDSVQALCDWGYVVYIDSHQVEIRSVEWEPGGITDVNQEV